MADIQYLNYGDLQIELLALMNNLANSVQSYVQKQPWSNKRKEKFMSAYSDLMNRGITGASNTTGQWVINFGGENLDLSTKDKKDQEMYLEAAYFILQQMAGLPTKASQEDETKKKAEEEKSKLPLYNNFKDNFLGFVNKTYFGNNPMRIGSGEEDDWNYLDERDSTGKRGTIKRAARLALYLEDYSKSLEEGKFNFEGSSYTDLADLKSKINNAITYLKDGKIDLNDKDALNALGLKTSEYFNNGTGDLSGEFNSEGQELTYGQLAEYNAAQAKIKQQQAIELLKAARANQWDRMTFLGAKLNGKPLSAEHSTMGYLLGLASKANLSGDEASELVGAFKLAARTGQLLSLSKEELLKFGRFQGYNNPNRLKKINNLEGVYWDTIGNRIVRPYMSTNVPLTSFLDILDLNKPKTLEELQLEYLNKEGAEYAELGAIAADIASIIDPEPFSAMGLSLGAAGARNYAKLLLPGKWNWKDYGSQTIDYLTSVIGAVPVVGDAVLAGKVIKGLRKLARVGAWSDVLQSTPGLKDIWDKKIMGDEKMTILDWRTVGTALRGIISHGRMNQSNLAARKVMEKNGIQVNPEEVKGIKANINKWTQKTGFTRTKPAESATTTTTLKIKDENGKIVEVPITEKVKLDLEKSFKGKSSEEKLKIIKGNADVKEAAKGKIDLEKATGLNTPKSIRNVPGVRNYVGTNKGIFNTTTTYTPIAKLEANFEGYLLNRSIWNKIGLGSNNYLRRINNLLNLGSVKPIETTSTKTTTTTNSNIKLLPNLNPLVKDSPISRNVDVSSYLKVEPYKKVKKVKTNEFPLSTKEILVFLNAYFGKGTMRNSGYGDINYSNPGKSIKAGELTFELPGGKKISFKVSKEELKDASPNKINEIRLRHAKLILDLIKLEPARIMGPILKDLKKAGFLKQGGTIDKLKIQKYKEYIKK